MKPMLLGAACMASGIAALFFLRFWRDTHDRFFLYFAIAFALEGLNRLVLGVLTLASEHESYFYLLRLLGFLLILVAIVDKNRSGASGARP
jgi:hypothetical protein